MSELVVFTDDNMRVIPSFHNEELRVATERIVEFIRGAGINYFKIAVQLKLIKDLELYKEDGFVSVYDYAERVFGYSRTSVVRMIKTANLYLEKDGSSTIFLKEGKDFGISQLRELLSLPKSEVIDLVEEGKITPEMTKDQIREAVKAKKSKVIDISEEENDENDENVEEKSDNILDSSISSSVDNLSVETPLQAAQNALGSLSNSSEKPVEENSSSYSGEHELKSSDIDFMIARLNGDEESKEEEYSSAPYEFYFFNCKKECSESKRVEDIGLDELVYSDILGRFPKELRDYIELTKKEICRLNYFRTIESVRMEELEEEVKRLKEDNTRLAEENYKLLHPVRRKRGRPRKNN